MTSEGGARLGRQAAYRLAQLDCCVIEAGLTEAEFARIEHEYGFEFADDHRAFLAVGLRVHEPREEEPGASYAWEGPWPDWRNGDPDQLRQQLNWPVDCLLEDVQGGHWHPAGDERPGSIEAAVDLARTQLARVPKMIPVYAHRFLPAGHGTFGHPVLSMWGCDIIQYGTDLLDYPGPSVAKAGHPESPSCSGATTFEHPPQTTLE
ncbi:hypothetical protein [Actinomadura meridiana]|uniref:hypothetical protein n=1 Tax=Actinomadura meridiana TaxID=559626 RepID=UPI0031EFFC1B